MASPGRRRLLRCMAVICGLAGPLAAQGLRVYSEFRRIDPYGEIVPSDRGGRVREVLSPAMMRDSTAWFQVVMDVPPGAAFQFFIGQNPDNVVRTSVYRPRYARLGGHWFPDRLERVTMPYSGVLPTSGPVPDARAAVFWMEVHVPRSSPAGRVRLEAQLNVGENWFVYPMEVRVLFLAIPPIIAQPVRLPAVSDPSTAAALAPLHAYLCDAKTLGQPAGNASPGIREAIRRGAQQDIALARQVAVARSRETVVSGIFRAIAVEDRAAWCASAPAPPPIAATDGPEWYWRVRDFLYRLAVN